MPIRSLQLTMGRDFEALLEGASSEVVELCPRAPGKEGEASRHAFDEISDAGHGLNDHRSHTVGLNHPTLVTISGLSPVLGMPVAPSP